MTTREQRQVPTEQQRRAYAQALAEAEAAQDGFMMAHLGEGCPLPVTAAAKVLGLNAGELDWHVGAVHGWEPHDEGYEEAVWAAAGCDDLEHLASAARWGPRISPFPVPVASAPAPAARDATRQPRRTTRTGRRRR